MSWYSQLTLTIRNEWIRFLTERERKKTNRLNGKEPSSMMFPNRMPTLIWKDATPEILAGRKKILIKSSVVMIVEWITKFSGFFSFVRSFFLLIPIGKENNITISGNEQEEKWYIEVFRSMIYDHLSIYCWSVFLIVLWSATSPFRNHNNDKNYSMSLGLHLSFILFLERDIP